MLKISMRKRYFSIILIMIVWFVWSGEKQNTSLHKIAHVSFDDVYLCLKDLRDNANNYKSIFDQPFLGYLRTLHDSYGASFELYVYEKAVDWSIDQVPNKFEDEFKRSSNWLRWGFHATSPEYVKSEQSQVVINSICIVDSSITAWGGGINRLFTFALLLCK